MNTAENLKQGEFQPAEEAKKQDQKEEVRGFFRKTGDFLQNNWKTIGFSMLGMAATGAVVYSMTHRSQGEDQQALPHEEESE